MSLVAMEEHSGLAHGYADFCALQTLFPETWTKTQAEGDMEQKRRGLFLYLLFLSAFPVGQIWGSFLYSSLQSTGVLQCFTSRLMQMGDMGNHAQDKTGWMLKMFGNHSSELLRSYIFKLRLALLIWKPLINEEQIAYLLHLHNQANFAFTNHAK